MITQAKWIVFLFPLALHLLWIVFIPNEPISDPYIYHTSAVSIAAGHGYIDDLGKPAGRWAPGYPFYIAFFYWLFKPSYSVAFAANFISTIFLVAGVYAFTSRLYNKNVAWIASLLTALWPSFILYNTVIASDILFSALLIWALYFAWIALQEKNLFIATFSGILFGFATLTRQQALVMPLVLFVMEWVQKKSIGKSLLFFLGISVIMLIICLPWTIRNEKVFGHYSLVSINFGDALWYGNHSKEVTKPFVDPKLSLYENNERLGHEAIRYILDNPGTYFLNCLKRIYVTLNSESIAVDWNKIGIKRALGSGAILPLTVVTNGAWFLLLIGVVWSLLTKIFQKQDWILITIIILLSIPFILILGEERYHIYLIPYLLILATRK